MLLAETLAARKAAAAVEAATSKLLVQKFVFVMKEQARTPSNVKEMNTLMEDFRGIDEVKLDGHGIILFVFTFYLAFFNFKNCKKNLVTFLYIFQRKEIILRT